MTMYFIIFYGLLSSFYFYPRKENWSQKQTLNYDSTRKYIHLRVPEVGAQPHNS